jgi:hypothetical protein
MEQRSHRESRIPCFSPAGRVGWHGAKLLHECAKIRKRELALWILVGAILVDVAE